MSWISGCGTFTVVAKGYEGNMAFFGVEDRSKGDVFDVDVEMVKQGDKLLGGGYAGEQEYHVIVYGRDIEDLPEDLREYVIGESMEVL